MRVKGERVERGSINAKKERPLRSAPCSGFRFVVWVCLSFGFEPLGKGGCGISNHPSICGQDKSRPVDLFSFLEAI